MAAAAAAAAVAGRKVFRPTRGRRQTPCKVDPEAAAAQTDPTEQIVGWERHFERHATAAIPFFKERRALLEQARDLIGI